jgi:hypothetical protein
VPKPENLFWASTVAMFKHHTRSDVQKPKSNFKHHFATSVWNALESVFNFTLFFLINCPDIMYIIKQ